MEFSFCDRVGVTTMAAAAVLLGATSASAQQSDPYPTASAESMQACGTGAGSLFGQSSGLGDGTFDTIADNFSVQHGQWWCNATPGHTETFGRDGLTITADAQNPATSDTNTEIITRPGAKPGMSMSTRIGPSDLTGLQGSRGWGFWNRSLFNSVGQSAIAWFMYQDGTTCPGAYCPAGFFAMTQRVGNSDAEVDMLPTSLLSKEHTYTVTLTKNSVIYLVAGKHVADVTNPDVVPTTATLGQIWVDNMYYGAAGAAGLSQFVPLPQPNTNPSTVTARWYWQGPASEAPMGATMTPGSTSTTNTPRTCKAHTVLLNTLGKTRITSVKVLVNGKRLMIFHGKRLHKVRVSGLPAVGRHSIQIDAFSGRRAVLRSKYTLLACNWTPDKHTPSSNGAARPTKAHDRSVA